MRKGTLLATLLFAAACSQEGNLPTDPAATPASAGPNLTAATDTTYAPRSNRRRPVSQPGFAIIAPSCANPAPLNGRFDARAPGFIVVFKGVTDSATEVRRLEQLYGFRAKFVYDHALEGFAAELTPQAVAGLRCEPTVAYIEHDAVGGIAGGR